MLNFFHVSVAKCVEIIEYSLVMNRRPDLHVERSLMKRNVVEEYVVCYSCDPFADVVEEL